MVVRVVHNPRVRRVHDTHVVHVVRDVEQEQGKETHDRVTNGGTLRDTLGIWARNQG